MKGRLLLLPSLLLLGAAAPAEHKPPADAGAGSCLTAGCHIELGAGRVVHAAVEAELCDACHEYSGTGHRFKPVPSPIDSACKGCHDDPRDDRNVPHPPAHDGECTTCHDPHSSDVDHLLTDQPVDLCTTCHGEIETELHQTSLHDVVRTAGCAVCHDPHGGQRTRLLRAEGNELCAACHLLSAAAEPAPKDDPVTIVGGGKVAASIITEAPQLALKENRGHPLRRHPVAGVADPRHPGISIGCLSCHLPHGSTKPHLARTTTPGGLCRECHKK